MLRNLALERAVIHRAILNEVLSLNAQEYVNPPRKHAFRNAPQ